MPDSSLLGTIKDSLAIVGALAIAFVPLAKAYAKSFIHGAIGSAPAILSLDSRVRVTETWQEEHRSDVALIPRLAGVLERMERAVDGLNATLNTLLLQRRAE